MHRPKFRPRLTLKNLMAAVAVAAVGLAVIVGLTGWADGRRAKLSAIGYRYAIAFGELSRQRPPADPRLLTYYDAMRKKYYHAARYPWLPVMPDPPEPE